RYSPQRHRHTENLPSFCFSLRLHVAVVSRIRTCPMIRSSLYPHHRQTSASLTALIQTSSAIFAYQRLNVPFPSPSTSTEAFGGHVTTSLTQDISVPLSQRKESLPGISSTVALAILAAAGRAPLRIFY